MEARMAEILILALILILSIALAVYSFGHARRLHDRIETMHPGFNYVMRELQKHRWRR
jgi:hypothetical protein